MLEPLQIPQERRVSALVPLSSLDKPVCIRTCYDSKLEEQYEQKVHAVQFGDGFGVHKDMGIDNADLYDFGSACGNIVDRN